MEHDEKCEKVRLVSSIVLHLGPGIDDLWEKKLCLCDRPETRWDDEIRHAAISGMVMPIVVEFRKKEKREKGEKGEKGEELKDEKGKESRKPVALVEVHREMEKEGWGPSGMGRVIEVDFKNRRILSDRTYQVDDLSDPNGA